MTNADLATVAPGVAPTVTITTLNAGKGYCLDNTNSGKMAYYVGGDTAGDAAIPVTTKISAVTTGAVAPTVAAS